MFVEVTFLVHAVMQAAICALEHQAHALIGLLLRSCGDRIHVSQRPLDLFEDRDRLGESQDVPSSRTDQEPAPPSGASWALARTSPFTISST
jgi:hypothetical protein